MNRRWQSRGQSYLLVSRLSLLILVCIGLGYDSLSSLNPVQAQASSAKLFGLPLTVPPGPTTWLLDQQYGNTIGAFNYGQYWYAAGQGLHFGVDFATPCGTPIVAIADGEIDQVDNFSFGLQPHNLTIYHRALHYTSLYGHLLAKPTGLKGQPVKRGDVIGLSGDPDLTCKSRPHLHLEIRSSDYHTAYNPINLMDADWNMLSSIGYYQYGGFVKDLYHPDQWQTPDSQPDVNFNQDTLNNFNTTWPPPVRNQPAPITLPPFAAPPLGSGLPTMQQLTKPGCCSEAWWRPDSQAVRYFDGPDGQLAGTVEVKLDGSSPAAIDNYPLKLQSTDGQYEARWEGGRVTMVRLADQMTWPLATGSAWPRFSPDNKHIMWHRYPADDVPGGIPPATEVWVAKPDGSGRTLVRVQQGGLSFWLDNDRLLLTEAIGRTYDAKLSIYTLSTGKIETLLAAVGNPRGITIAPGGARIVYYRPFQDKPEDSGLFMLETKPGAVAIKLPFFGSWRWRDSNSLLYIPYGVEPFQIKLYDIFSGKERAVTDPAKPITIMDDEWRVSPDGQRILFWKASDLTLWTLTLPK